MKTKSRRRTSRRRTSRRRTSRRRTSHRRTSHRRTSQGLQNSPFRGSAGRKRDTISIEMDFVLTLDSGEEVGRRTAQKIFVMAELQERQPLTPYRQPFTENDKKQIFWRRSTRNTVPIDTEDPYESWKQTPEGKSIINSIHDEEDDEDDEDELPGDDEPRLRRRLVPTMVSSNTSSVSSSITFINNPMPGELRYINAVRSLEDRARNNTILGDDENDEEIDFNHP